MSNLNKISKRYGILILMIFAISQVSIAQKVLVSGSVNDAEGEPLPGVSVMEAGTTNGTITDVEGAYSIDVRSQNAILVFSYVGYQKEEIPVSGRTTINLSLREDFQSLEEIIVVGYAEQKRVNLTGSVSVITERELEARPITNLSQAFSGTATGITVTQSDGQPGRDGATLRIRGIGTRGDASPLVLVDGIESSMADLEPSNIESISILKDAAAASIYGSRAANGVILITTKKGKAGTFNVTYNGYVGFQEATRLMDYVSDFATYMEMNNVINPMYSQTEIDAWRENPDDPLRYPNVNWVDIVYGGRGMLQSHSLSMNGGNERTRYNFSFGYLDQDGLVPENWSKRYNLRLNWEASIRKNMVFGTNIFGSWKNIADPNIGNTFNYHPGIPYEKDEFGRYGYSQAFGGGNVDNPRAKWESITDYERSMRFLPKFYLNWEIIKGLTYSGNFAVEFNNRLNTSFNGYYEMWNFRTNTLEKSTTKREARNSNNENYTLTNYHTLNYTRTINAHHISLLGGISLETFRSDNFTASIVDFPNNEIQVLGVGLEDAAVGGGAAEWALLSYFGRFNYRFREKYLFEANMRYDGSSRFKEGNRWGAFPSFSAGWRLSEEDFIKDNVAWINHLKIRASWGMLGNQNIGNYPYQSTYSLGQNYSFGGVIYSGVASTSLVDSDITWESTTTSNLGLDASLFKKLNLSVEVFHRLTEDILTDMKVPKTLGDKSNPTVNFASFKNTGYEVSANYREKIGSARLHIGLNFTQVDNEVTKFLGEIQDLGNYITQEGLPYQSMYGYVADGIIRSQEELDELNELARELSGDPSAYYMAGAQPGAIKYKDLDANGIIDSQDREVIGNTIPRYTFGLSFGAELAGFDLNVLLSGVAGKDGYLSGVGIEPFGAGGDRGQLPAKWVDNYWTVDRPDAELPALWHVNTYAPNTYFSTYWKQDASFIRLKSLQLGYTLPKTILTGIGVKKVRIYASGENLLTWTKFEGFDPERGMTDRSINYPNVKTIISGIQVTF